MDGPPGSNVPDVMALQQQLNQMQRMFQIIQQQIGPPGGGQAPAQVAPSQQHLSAPGYHGGQISHGQSLSMHVPGQSFNANASGIPSLMVPNNPVNQSRRHPDTSHGVPPSSPALRNARNSFAPGSNQQSFSTPPPMVHAPPPFRPAAPPPPVIQKNADFAVPPPTSTNARVDLGFQSSNQTPRGSGSLLSPLSFPPPGPPPALPHRLPTSKPTGLPPGPPPVVSNFNTFAPPPGFLPQNPQKGQAVRSSRPSAQQAQTIRPLMSDMHSALMHNTPAHMVLPHTMRPPRPLLSRNRVQGSGSSPGVSGSRSFHSNAPPTQQPQQMPQNMVPRASSSPGQLKRLSTRYPRHELNRSASSDATEMQCEVQSSNNTSVRVDGISRSASFTPVERECVERGDMERGFSENNVSAGTSLERGSAERSNERFFDRSVDDRSPSCRSISEQRTDRKRCEAASEGTVTNRKRARSSSTREHVGEDNEQATPTHRTQSINPVKWVSSSPAKLYFTVEKKTGNTRATELMMALERRFDEEILQRSVRTRIGRTPYSYPPRTSRLHCCESHNCHDTHSECGSDTDDSELEEGEICSDEEKAEDDSETIHYSEELLAKLNHPERLHKELWFNDKGEAINGPACRCSKKNQSRGVRHGLFVGEEALPLCDPSSSNLDRLFHYRVAVDRTENFLSKNPTKITYDERDYVFEGFSIFSHKKLENLTELKRIIYHMEYTIHFVEEAAPENFTVHSLDLVSDYLFYELLELVDMDWKQAKLSGCRQIHVMPRFVRPLPEEGVEVLSMSEVLKFLLDASRPVVAETDLASVLSMDNREWRNVVDQVQGTLVTIPGKRPSTVRLDNLDRVQQSDSVITWPIVVHFGMRPDEVCYAGCAEYVALRRKRNRQLRLIANKMTKPTEQDRQVLCDIEEKMVQLTSNRSMRRDVTVDVSCDGFYRTGLRPDVTQHALNIPLALMHLRFHLSLGHLQNSISYNFKDIDLLQLSLTHPSHINMDSFGTNADHIKNTLSNCGLRNPIHGEKAKSKPSIKRKRGLRALLSIMSLQRPQPNRLARYDNERLEFLGDAVLEFISSVHLFYVFPKLEEGGLATYRTALVQNDHLSVLADKLNLQDYLLYSHGPDLCHTKQLNHALANSFEALLGAVYLDGGLDCADRLLTHSISLEFMYPEFVSVWAELPLHPLQEDLVNGDRDLISGNPILERCARFEDVSGLQFDHIRLLARALTHCSTSYNAVTEGHNQTMEFLGDTVLQLISSDFLYRKFPDHHEGHLTLLRSTLVSNSTQALIFDDMNILDYIIKQNQSRKVTQKEKADYVEALLGALYIDQGLEICRAFCDVCFFPRLKDIILNHEWNDPKSQLQQCCLALRDIGSGKEPDIPTYKLIESKGPSNARVYRVAVYFKDKRLATGTGSSIQKAEFSAATQAMLDNEDLFPMLNEQMRYESKFYAS